MSLKLAKKSSKSLLIIEDYVMMNEKVKVELTPEEELWYYKAIVKTETEIRYLKQLES